MRGLVADIGGTHSRFALVHQGAFVPSSIKVFANENADSFVDLARQFIAGSQAGTINACVIALAGPVSGRRARLTNLSWDFDADALQHHLDIPSVTLMNDLSAAGYAVPTLSSDQLLPLHQPRGSSGEPGQSLVVGLGTGFNLCPIIQTATDVHCLEMEFGHVALPCSVQQALGPALRALIGPSDTVEDWFSGRGFARFQDAGGTVEAYAALLGALSRELVVGFLPRGGIYFNGGVARSVLSGPEQDAFVRSFARPFAQWPDLSAPVSLILDDAAALWGCATRLARQSQELE